jgi:hypothetical protein
LEGKSWPRLHHCYLGSYPDDDLGQHIGALSNAAGRPIACRPRAPRGSTARLALPESAASPRNPLRPMPKRPIHPREVHQGAHGRQKAGCGIFPTLPEGTVPNRGRELAPPAIGKYRVHHETVARADRRRQSPGAEGEGEMMARVGKRKIGTWSYKQQRELIELAAASQSLETIANRMGRPTATILKKAAQLGISIKRQKAAP